MFKLVVFVLVGLLVAGCGDSNLSHDLSSTQPEEVSGEVPERQLADAGVQESGNAPQTSDVRYILSPPENQVGIINSVVWGTPAPNNEFLVEELDPAWQTERVDPGQIDWENVEIPPEDPPTQEEPPVVEEPPEEEPVEEEQDLPPMEEDPEPVERVQPTLVVEGYDTWSPDSPDFIMNPHRPDNPMLRFRAKCEGCLSDARGIDLIEIEHVSTEYRNNGTPDNSCTDFWGKGQANMVIMAHSNPCIREDGGEHCDFSFTMGGGAQDRACDEDRANAMCPGPYLNNRNRQPYVVGSEWDDQGIFPYRICWLDENALPLHEPVRGSLLCIREITYYVVTQEGRSELQRLSFTTDPQDPDSVCGHEYSYWGAPRMDRAQDDPIRFSDNLRNPLDAYALDADVFDRWVNPLLDLFADEE